MAPFQDGWTEDEVEAAIARGLPEELAYVPIAVSMDPPDLAWAQGICIALAVHPHPGVRGNAILGFGHLARSCGRLDAAAVVPLIVAALGDDSDYVRGHAIDAADDLQHFLGICVPRPGYRSPGGPTGDES